MKVLNYLFPMENPNQLKVFQSPNSKIRGISFKRNNEVSNYIKGNLNEFASNYGIYVLKSNLDGQLKLYIGQSTKGYERVFQHKGKEFWSEGILFVTENNSWDKTVIDYLEYKLINIFSASKYTLENMDMRSKEPVLDIFQKSMMNDLEKEILFLLASNGIDYKSTLEISNQSVSTKNLKVYKAAKNNNASLVVEEGMYVLLKGSEVKRPVESSKDWQNGNFHKGYNRDIDNFIDLGKILEVDSKLIVQSNIAFTSPSRPAGMTSGYSENGFLYWKGLDELRQGETDGV